METYRLQDRVRHRQYTSMIGKITGLRGQVVQIELEPTDGDKKRENHFFQAGIPFLLKTGFALDRRIVLIQKDLFPIHFEKVSWPSTPP